MVSAAWRACAASLLCAAAAAIISSAAFAASSAAWRAAAACASRTATRSAAARACRGVPRTVRRGVGSGGRGRAVHTRLRLCLDPALLHRLLHRRLRLCSHLCLRHLGGGGGGRRLRNLLLRDGLALCRRLFGQSDCWARDEAAESGGGLRARAPPWERAPAGLRGGCRPRLSSSPSPRTSPAGRPPRVRGR